VSTGRPGPPTDRRDGWGWRQRLRDPRTPALLFGGACAGAGVAILRRDRLRLDVPGVVFALLVVAGILLAALPPWRGSRHGPRVGAVTASLSGLTLLAVALVLAFGFGVHLAL